MKNPKFIIVAILISFSILFFHSMLIGQCPPGGVSFNTQAQVDAFAVSYPTCNTITGSLNITWSSDINDLTPLSNLTSISGQLYIRGNSILSSLNGLHNVTSVGSIYLRQNNGLTSIELDNLSHVNGNFYAREDYITSIADLTQLQKVDGNLELDMSELASMGGLTSLDTIGGNLDMSTDELDNLIGLENLTHIGGDFSFVFCPQLDNISQVNSNLTVGGTLELRYCNQLNSCAISAFCNHLSAGGNHNIANNGNGCATVEQIIDNCPTPPGCSDLVIPEHGDTDVDISTDLTWTPASGVDGYILQVGTTPFGNDLVDSLDVGNVTTYDLPSDLPYNQDIFVLLRSYTSGVLASGCFEESFKTQIDLSLIPNFIINNSTSLTATSDNSYDCEWGDYNGDGRQDVYLAIAYGDQKNKLFLNVGNMTFINETNGAIVNDVYRSEGSSWGDFDGDGDVDMYVSNDNNGQENNLYRNDGNTFQKILTGDHVTDLKKSDNTIWVDVDNDGYPEIYVANGPNQTNDLYENNADGTFTKRLSGVEVTAASTTYNCASEDVNIDGFQDLFLCQSGVNILYINDGSGGFTEMTTGDLVTESGTSYNSDWGDFDNDGDIDIVVGNSGSSNSVRLYQNDGTGVFSRVITPDVGAECRSVVWIDLNDDGHLDVYGGAYNAGGKILMNNGDGTFQELTGQIINNIPNRFIYDMEAVDMDDDGDEDIYIVAGGGQTAQSNLVLENKAYDPATGPCQDLFIQFTELESTGYPAINQLVTVQNVGSLASDVQGVGLKTWASVDDVFGNADDLAVSDVILSAGSLTLNPGETTQISYTASIDSMLYPHIFLEVDYADIITECSEQNNHFGVEMIYGCLQFGAHNFDPLATVSFGCETCSDLVLNGDETNIDCGGAICPNCLPDCTTMSAPMDGEQFVNPGVNIEWTTATNGPIGYKISVGTCNGCYDIANEVDLGNVLSYTPPAPFNTGEIFVKIIPYSIHGDAIGCIEESFSVYEISYCDLDIYAKDSAITFFYGDKFLISDIDSDGYDDIVSNRFGSNPGISWHENDGNGNFTENVISGPSNWVWNMASFDVNGDGYTDIVESDDAVLRYWQNDGAQNFTFQIINGSIEHGGQILHGDVDGDGDIDMVMNKQDLFYYSINWYKNNGSGSFTEHYIGGDFNHDIFRYEMADMDGDSDLDIVVVDIDADELAYYENNGSGSFTHGVIETPFEGLIHLGDLDMDGDQDILLQQSEVLSALYNNSNWSFTKEVLSISPGLFLHNICLGDVDNDGDMDISGVSPSLGEVHVFENDAQIFCVNNIDTLPTYDFVGGIIADLDYDGTNEIYHSRSGTTLKVLRYKYEDSDISDFGDLFWSTTNGYLMSSSYTGDNIQTLHSFGLSITGFALDKPNQTFYIPYRQFQGKIVKYDHNTESITDLVTGLNYPFYVAVDETNQKLYWVTLNGELGRVDLTGANAETLQSNLNEPLSIAIDELNERVFVLEQDGRKITMYGNGGCNPIKIYDTASDGLYDMSLDKTTNEMYFSTWGEDKIKKINLDTEVVSDVISNLTNPDGLELSLDQQKLYWADIIADAVFSCNLDGTNLQTVANNIANPIGLNLYLGSATGTDILDCVNYVENTNNSGLGSLDYALGCTAPGDTIYISDCLQGQTLILEPQVFNITEDLTLKSNIDYNIEFRTDTDPQMIFIPQGVSVYMEGLHLANNLNSSAIFYNEGELTLKNIEMKVTSSNGQLSIKNYGNVVMKKDVNIVEE